MSNESFVIKADGEETTDVYDELISLEVELSDELPATFRMSIAMSTDPSSGTWRFQDEERFRIWKQVDIAVGFVDSGPEDLFSGYITRVQPRYPQDDGQCVLEIAGIDGSVLMDREEKLKDWPDKADSDIAREILGAYPLEANVDDTEIVHEEAASTVIQRETDLRFVQRLARRNGFTFYVDGGTANFKRVDPQTLRHPILAAHFGAETSLSSFRATVDALRPARVSMFQLDHLSKEVLVAEVDSLESDPLGSLDAAAFLPPSFAGPSTVYVANNAVTGRPEMDALCQHLFTEGAAFVTGEGDVDSSVYNHVLRPRGLVTIKGVGETYSGDYYVSFVRHTITRGGYSQLLRVTRNALLPTGDEEFSAGGGLGDLL